MVEEDETIFIDSGSTTLAMAGYLAEEHCRVMTISVVVAAALAIYPGVEVALPSGGQVYQFGEIVGMEVAERLSRFGAQKAFLGADGIDASGVTKSHVLLQQITCALLAACCGPVVMVAEHSKVGRRGLCRVCELSQVDTVITDSKAEAQHLDILRAAGISVVVASSESSAAVG
jgi:DeoR/GlpR family transcriptional regulator of sugar metabolism